MRLLANENVPGRAVDSLRAGGHDVLWARSDAPGSSDEELLHRASAEQRLLITLDKDFGELAFRRGLPAEAGIILIRITLSSPGQISQVLADALNSRTDWAGHFAVIEEHQIRMTPLPPSKRGAR
jgi:predicted nuclease of predicted toxin-antitoxin system